MTTAKEVAFQALPFTPTIERASILSEGLRALCRFETLFTDYERACDSLCMDCDLCERRKQHMIRTLTDPYARVWEVWSEEETPSFAGLLYLTRIIPGGDAYAHYAFFDRDLRSKTALLEQMIQWCFTGHADWIALRRLTIEIPDYAHALARHAQKYLSFGGPFTHNVGGKPLSIEGVRKHALVWRGQPRDMLILGRLNG